MFEAEYTCPRLQATFLSRSLFKAKHILKQFTICIYEDAHCLKQEIVLIRLFEECHLNRRLFKPEGFLSRRQFEAVHCWKQYTVGGTIFEVEYLNLKII